MTEPKPGLKERMDDFAFEVVSKPPETRKNKDIQKKGTKAK
jgi:hypothetical protein